MNELGDLSDEDLLARLRRHVGRGNIWLAGLLAYLAEVDARRLYAEQACTSTWDFCVRKFGMSESEAQRRIAVARLVWSFPLAGGYLERGEVHLSALYELHKHLTADNHEELLRGAVGKTTRAVAEMLAARYPKPDVHACVEPLAPQSALPVASTETLPPREGAVPAMTQVRARVEPLSASRYRVELTVSAEANAKLERVQNLMRHRNPSGDLEKIFEASLDLLLAKLEKERLGKTTRSKVKSPTANREGADETGSARPNAARREHIARGVQREVWARDAEQCTYVDAEGHRCPARGFLELDHIHAKALGGSDDAANLRLRCRVHNRLHAERVFGRKHIEARIDLRQRESVAPAHAPRSSSATLQAPGESVATLQAPGESVATFQASRKSAATLQASRKSAATLQVPRKSAVPAEAPSFETAARGLRSLGFREPEVREVIGRLARSLEPGTSVETIVRDALRLLT